MASASSLPSQDEKEYLKRLLECSICLETFDDPRTLSCLHSFCKKCLENFVDGKSEDKLNCPVCRTKFTLNKGGVSGMTRNHFICNMVEVLSVQNQDKCIPCAHCEQPSVGRCVTCEDFMCGKCFKPHNQFPKFQDHDVLTLKELSKPENQSKIKGVSKCSRHPKKKLKYYCETCDELICRHCMDFTHDKQHKFSPVEDAARRKRQGLEEYCELMESTIARSNKTTQVFKKDLESLTNNYEEAQRLINEKRVQLIAKVDKKTNSMREIVRQNFHRKTKCIEDEKTKTQTFMNRMKSSIDMSRSVLRDGNDEEIVRLYKSVQENVDSAKEKNDEKTYDDDDVVVLPWNSNEIDKMLLEEVQKHFKEKDLENLFFGKNYIHKINISDDSSDEELDLLRKLEFDPQTGMLGVEYPGDRITETDRPVKRTPRIIRSSEKWGDSDTSSEKEKQLMAKKCRPRVGKPGIWSSRGDKGSELGFDPQTGRLKMLHTDDNGKIQGFSDLHAQSLNNPQKEIENIRKTSMADSTKKSTSPAIVEAKTDKKEERGKDLGASAKGGSAVKSEPGVHTAQSLIGHLFQPSTLQLQPSRAAQDLRSGHPGVPSGLWSVYVNAPLSGSGRGASTSSSGSHRPQQMTSHSTATQQRSQIQERPARDGAIPVGKLNASGYF